jgi:hypothetical protein
MDLNLSALERAFQLARSGQVSNVEDIRKRLKQEATMPTPCTLANPSKRS